MKTRKDLCPWIVEALKANNGSSNITNVRKFIWENHDEEIRNSGNLLFSWQEDIYWAATQLRAQGILKKAKATSKSVWEIA